MFRIKNLRSSTVAKQTNIPASINQYPHISHLKPIQPVINNKVNIANPINQKNSPVPKNIAKKVEPIKISLHSTKHKLKFNAEPERTEAMIDRRIKIDPNKLKIHNMKHEPKRQSKINLLNSDVGKEKQPQEVKNNQRTKSRQQINSQEEKHQEILINLNQKELQQTKQIKIEEQITHKHQNKLKLQVQNQIKQEIHQDQEQIQEIKDLKNREQAKRQRELHDTIEKVNARRKARQLQRQHRKKMQEAMNNQSQPDSTIGGIINLTDGLTHIEMSQKIMDAQINMILKMKFANFPNKQAIQLQVQELQRINRSYLLVRLDPNNSLIRGLSNFRIELFNKVGELIMQGQAEMGPNTSGLHVINADSRTYPEISGIRITRGLEGHIQSLLKEQKLQEVQECAICLGEMQKGQMIYNVKCGHKFHKKCLQSWLNTNANCPSCRYNIKFDKY